MVVFRLILIYLVAAAGSLKNAPPKTTKSYRPQRSTANLLLDLSDLLPEYMQSLAVPTDTKAFDKGFCRGTIMECAESITKGRWAVVDMIKTKLYRYFKKLLERYVEIMPAVVEQMTSDYETTDKIMKTISMSGSFGFAVLEFLYDNGVAVHDVLGLYIVCSDIEFMCEANTVRRAVERASTNSGANNAAKLSKSKSKNVWANLWKTKKDELLYIRREIDSLAKMPLQVNRHPKWMTADVLKWKNLMSRSPVNTEIASIVCTANGLTVSSWFGEIKTTADPKKVAAFYTGVGNALIDKVHGTVERQTTAIEDLLIAFVRSSMAIDQCTDALLVRCESEDRKLLFRSIIVDGDWTDAKDYQCEQLESEKMENKKTEISKNERTQKRDILQTYNTAVGDIGAFISSVEFFAGFMYNARRFTSAHGAFDMVLGRLKHVHKTCLKMNYDYLNMTNKLKTIIGELDLSESRLEKIPNGHSEIPTTVGFIRKNTQFMKDLNDLFR